MIRKRHKRGAKQQGRSFYIVVSGTHGLLWEWRLGLPSLRNFLGLFFGIVFSLLLVFLFEGLFGNLDDTDVTESLPPKAFVKEPPLQKKGRLAYNIKNIQKKIETLSELQSKLQHLRFLSPPPGPLPLVRFSYHGSKGNPNHPAEAGGGPDRAFDWTPMRPLLQGMRFNRAALLDLEGFAISYDFWIRSWPHLWPLRRKRQHITSGYGYRKNPTRPFAPMQFHKGVDLRGSIGTPVQAVADGTVHIAKSKSYGYGKRIRIVHDTGFETLYGHLSHIYVSENQRVRAGSLIGLVGNTGNSTGPHLHYEVRLKGHAQNPMLFLDQ